MPNKPLTPAAQSAVKELQDAAMAYCLGAEEWHRLEEHPGPFRRCHKDDCAVANAIMDDHPDWYTLLREAVNKSQPKRLKVVVGDHKGESMDNDDMVFAGAAAGRVFIGTKTDLVALTPDGARKLAQKLPELAALAESIEAGGTSPGIDQVNAKAGALVMNGYKWSQGCWRGPTGAAITAHGVTYPQATELAHHRVFSNGGQHG